MHENGSTNIAVSDKGGHCQVSKFDVYDNIISI